MATSRARAGHARHTRAGYATRALAALAVVATATGTLVASQVATPEAAQAAQEPAATGIDVGDVYASMGQGHTRENPTGANLNDSIRYGIVRGMTENRVKTGQSPMTTWLGGKYAKDNDAWTYIARGASGITRMLTTVTRLPVRRGCRPTTTSGLRIQTTSG